MLKIKLFLVFIDAFGGRKSLEGEMNERDELYIRLPHVPPIGANLHLGGNMRCFRVTDVNYFAINGCGDEVLLHQVSVDAEYQSERQGDGFVRYDQVLQELRDMLKSE